MNGSTLKLNRADIFASDNVTGVVTAGQTVNIDLKMLDDNFITGGILYTLDSKFGDYINLQVVDVDNILGYGINTILGQYCTNWYMCSDSQEQLNETVNYPAKILSGLYLRIVYHSLGLSDVTVIINYRLHKALY